MFGEGDDAGHCSNGLTAQRFRDATEEERATYWKWVRGIIVLYGALLIVSAVVVTASYSAIGLMQLTNLSAHHQIMVSPKPN